MEKKHLIKLHKSEIKILDEIVRICDKHNLQYFLIGGTLLGAVRHKGFIPWDDDLDIAMPRNDYEKFITIAKKELKNDFILDDISTNNQYWLIFAKVRLKNSLFDSGQVSNDYKKCRGIFVDIFPLDNTNHCDDFISKYMGKRVRLLKVLYERKASFSHHNKNYLLDIYGWFFMPRNNNDMYNKVEKTITKYNSSNNKYFVNYGSQYGVKKQTQLISKYLPSIKIEFEGKKYSAPKNYDYVLKKIYGDKYMNLPPVEKRVTHNPYRIIFEDGEEVIFD